MQIFALVIKERAKVFIIVVLHKASIQSGNSSCCIETYFHTNIFLDKCTFKPALI